MGEQGSDSSGGLEALLSTLRGWLHSDISIGQPQLMTFDRGSGVHPPDQEGVEVTVSVQNNAPTSFEGGEVVFIGVGLRISDGRQGPIERPGWLSGIQVTRPSDRQILRERYAEGAWVRGRERFPALTPTEESFGEVLFPGESVIYTLRIPKATLPYLTIQVEGSASRRHLFHFTQPVRALERYTRPLLVDTFRALNAVDIHGPLLTARSAMPELGPGTTLADLQSFRASLGQAIEQG